MRILSITAQKADSTGSGVFLTELVKGFEKAGHQQAVICGITGEDTLSFPAGVAVFPVYYGTPELPFPVCGMSDEMPYESTRYCDLTREMTEKLFCAFRRVLQQAVETFRPDMILCHHLYFAAALARQMYPAIPVYGQCHGSDLRQFRKNTWQHDFIRGEIAKLNGIFALHEEQKQLICETFGVPQALVTVIGTGYNSDVFRIMDTKKEVLEPEKLRLIFAGKLSEKKGVMSLIRALDHVQNPEGITLALAGGSGSEQEYAQICRLAQAAPCTVQFLGKLSQQELAEELNASDVFVLPSFYEGLPLVVIEAMACGLNVVCTDLPGIKKWLDGVIPHNGVAFVRPPEMRNEDEAVPESLPDFEKRLAAAVQTVVWNPLPDPRHVQAVSWDALCRRICSICE